MSTETESEVKEAGEQIASAIEELANSITHYTGGSLAGELAAVAQGLAGSALDDNITASLNRLTDAQEKNALATYALAESISAGFSELASAVLTTKQ